MRSISTAAMPFSAAALAAIILTADALPEIAIAKQGGHKLGLSKRDGTIQTTVYDILSYSSGGAYYANGMPIHFPKLLPSNTA